MKACEGGGQLVTESSPAAGPAAPPLRHACALVRLQLQLLVQLHALPTSLHTAINFLKSRVYFIHLGYQESDA